MSDHILSLKDVQTNIGQFHILEGVSLDVPVNKATVMLGRNGAGKTTTLESIMGLRPAFAGSIVFDGQEIIHKKDYTIPRLGIGYVPEDREIFTHLTIEQNLYISIRENKQFKDRLGMIFELFPDMEKYRHKKAGVLSGGQAQMLSISRALINENKLILIDEPSKGLAPLIIQDLIKKINDIKANCSILMVEQNFDMATAIGDVFYIIAEGQTVMQCTLDELLNNETIKNEYLGIS
ncbi:MAG: ABC transporter ATP-binding protein [Oscillospiraceae bacterium]|nr:ABC transporter ATP-binding protein [Oscillospiraceae bacterium]